MLYVSIALALNGPMSAEAAILGLLVSAAITAFAVWLVLSPYREKYADDPEGKRNPTLKRDTELVSMLWWDAVFYFVGWIVLGFGATLLLGYMGLLTGHQGALLGLFFLLTIPLIAASKSGGTAHAHLKAAWVEPLAKITRTVLRYGFGFFGLLIIYGTLNWTEGTWIEPLRIKGGSFFEFGYVAAIAAAVWFGFSKIWRAAKAASAAHDERQKAARMARRKARAKKTTPKPKIAVPAQSTSGPSQSPTPASDEFDSLRVSERELSTEEPRIERTQTQRERDSVEAVNKLLERAVEFDLEKLKKARAKWLEDVEYTPRPETREFAKLVFEDPRDEKCMDLIRAGANPNVTAGYVPTAFILACETGLSDLVKVMLENGAFPDQRGTYQHAALCNALSNNHSEIAMMLIDAGANVNTTGNCGFTPLMEAASNGNDAIVRVLMERGADSEYRVPAQYGGMNAKEIADHRGHSATAQLIEDLKSEYRPAVNIRHGAGYPVPGDAYYEEFVEVQRAKVSVRD